MLIRLKPRHRQRILLFAAFALVILGARMGVTVRDPGVAAKIAPLVNVNTQESAIGVIVEVFQAQPGAVGQCLSVLDENGIVATWFFSATFAESQAALIKQIIESGHEFGLSGTDDRAMDRLSHEEIELNLGRARDALIRISEPMPFFYAPSGRFNTELINAAFEQGFYSVKGSVDGKALRGKPEKAVKKIGDSLKSGDILIVRVGKRGMVPKPEYIDELARYVKGREFSLVSLSSLIRGMR
ncbi:MAG TPA: polysaccharide deacetylase family protein [Firmicutes bacterium]|nr:polysaccharide deacetylase family protein [Candidatus Fermentithermobacillaceae bacterium]